jgi:hypothetical protein
MGFELDAFLGKTSDLQRWTERLPAAVPCELTGELGMVPVTGKLYFELGALLTRAERERADGGRNVFPAPSYLEGAGRWGAEASKGTAVAWVSVGEFGNQSHEQVILWVDGQRHPQCTSLAALEAWFRKEGGLDLGPHPIAPLLEAERGEDAAERWVAAAGKATD